MSKKEYRVPTLPVGGVRHNQVTRYGLGSQDREDQLLIYQCTKNQGAAGGARESERCPSRFTTPYLAAPTAFEFTLTVTDDHGARARGSVLLTVEPVQPSRRPAPRIRYSQTGTTVDRVLCIHTLRPNERASGIEMCTGQPIRDASGDLIKNYRIPQSCAQFTSRIRVRHMIQRRRCGRHWRDE